ncbi:ribosomal RNA small subunit methyltransferase H [Alcanivorax sp. NBRC 101098]|uniref:hypothetical protein n=1 Tax=Alcanivorax sp. NBRC 101098 TaxID=1113728 RepID=UPI0004ABDDE9|nr:hypothetical protein [Alcanivorax sp. NBRC 101098]BAP15498.1 ribosomal RNA small subunit methyltransferase H [Alcanivorax sp. NBRC 101098]
MAKWKELKNQILAGTKEDSQGESNTKEFLESLCEGFSARGRIPLGLQHDISTESVGYIENFALVPSKDESEHWNLVGDVHFHDVDIDEALRGFSYSANIDMVGDIQEKALAAYLPYPDYRNEKLLEAISSVGDGIVAGAWKKKNADPVSVSLIISFLLFTASPAYTNFWNNKVSPTFKRIREQLGKKHKVEFVQVTEGMRRESFGVYFIPSGGGDGDFAPLLSQVTDAINMVKDHLKNDVFAVEKGVHLVKVRFSGREGRFVLLAVEYLDGSVINHSC